jgi:hypothetical protein
VVEVVVGGLGPVDVVVELLDVVVELLDVVVGAVAVHTVTVTGVLVCTVCPPVGVCCTTFPFVAGEHDVVVLTVTLANPLAASVDLAVVPVRPLTVGTTPEHGPVETPRFTGVWGATLADAAGVWLAT